MGSGSGMVGHMGVNQIGIVIPWFGKELVGGAEQLAWQVATRLAERGHNIEVLTTCCRAFQEDWATNHLRAGLSCEQGVTIRRFPVDPRDQVDFDRINAELLRLPSSELKPGVNPASSLDSSIFAKENINSSSLINHLRNHKNEYSSFIFIPYLYGPILNGLPIVADRAYFQPCLHNEVYAYLPEVEGLFRTAKFLLFNSEGEAELAQRLYGPGVIRRSEVIGAGIEVDAVNEASSIRRIGSFQVDVERFILYLGRRDKTKNTDLLVRTFLAFKNKYPNSRLKMVLAGPGNESFDSAQAGLIDLGLVSEKDKQSLLLNCLALFQPSCNESYSRTIMEAWSCGHPVAAHRDCLATSVAVESAQGGWLAGTESEWTGLFAEADCASKEELVRYGENGKSYAAEYAVWDTVIDRYEEVLGLTNGPQALSAKRDRRLKEVHQLLPNLAYGDAISNQALAIRDCLRTLGYESEVFVRYRDERVANEAKLFEIGAISKGAGLLYHHSIGSELTKYAMEHLGPKCLIHHNITPAEFFEPYRPEFARILEHGRSALNRLAKYFTLSVGDSAYNASELREYGFDNPGVLPIVSDPDKWNIRADPELMKVLQDGKANLLFVGRLVPNKKQDHLLEAFAYYLTRDKYARLILVGQAETGDPYYYHLVDTIERLGLSKHVVLAGLASDSQLAAYYRTAHLFWSMSEHEGFCVPILEAMWFDVPILAYKSTAIPETLGKSGIMFTRKDDLLQVAALAKLLARDAQLRAKVLKSQRRRRTDFLPSLVWNKLETLLDEMEHQQVELCKSESRPAKRVAFVVQRCGTEVNGGAEALCLKVAQRMSAYWEIEILTTCALTYMTWENHYQPGPRDVEGVRVRRFKVDRSRDVESFNTLSESLCDKSDEVSLAEQEEWMAAQGPCSQDLINYVKTHRDEYDAFIFFSYLYATTYFTLPLVEDKAYLVPCAHDEWPIYLTMWDSFFKRPCGIIFNTPEERDFLEARFPNAHLEGPIAGVTVQPPENFSGEFFRQQYGIHEGFLLYVGRIDPSKGCDELFRYFIEYRKSGTGSRKLILLGRAAMPIPQHPDIVSLGFVDEEMKWGALAACDLLLMPSRYESLSMVLLEAWSVGRPVLVNGACKVLVGQCRRSQGGLWYDEYQEFSEALKLMDRTVCNQLGIQGKRYVQHAYSWPAIEDAYLSLIQREPGPASKNGNRE